MDKIKELQAVMKQGQRLVIITHHHPDGDTIGSSLAFARLCEKEGQEVQVISPSIYPRFLRWMKGIDRVVILEEENKKDVGDMLAKADVLCCLDFTSLHRMGKLRALYERSRALKIAIDHHPDEKEGGHLDLLICDTKASATCALVYDLMERMGKMHHMDTTMATALYVGILTDTGCFSHSNTTSRVHWIVAQLMEQGVDTNGVYHAIYGNQSIGRMRFLANAITHRLVMMPTHGTAYFAIPRKDFMHFHLQPGDKAGIVSYALNLEGISLAAMIAEQKPDATKEVSLSFRSVGDIAVNELAADYFGGGGHAHAAGAVCRLPLQEVRERFEEMVRREMRVR